MTETTLEQDRAEILRLHRISGEFSAGPERGRRLDSGTPLTKRLRDSRRAQRATPITFTNGSDFTF